MENKKDVVMEIGRECHPDPRLQDGPACGGGVGRALKISPK